MTIQDIISLFNLPIIGLLLLAVYGYGLYRVVQLLDRLQKRNATLKSRPWILPGIIVVTLIKLWHSSSVFTWNPSARDGAIVLFCVTFLGLIWWLIISTGKQDRRHPSIFDD